MSLRKTVRNYLWHVRGCLDNGENPFFIKRARSWQDVARAFYLFLWRRTGERQKRTGWQRMCADLAFRNHRVQSGVSGCFFFFFCFSFCFPCASATLDRIIWSLLSSPKEQNASDPIRPPSRSWYMIYAPLPLSRADRGYLLIVSPGKEREREKTSLLHIPRDHGYHILPRSCPVRRVTYKLQVAS